MKINYQSDFDFIYNPVDCHGEAIGFPPEGVDWRVEFRTHPSGKVLTASCIRGVCVNCFNDGDRIHVVAKDHGLAPGRLVSTMTILNPNGMYGDGIQKIVDLQSTSIELAVGHVCQCQPQPPVVDVSLPVIAAKADEPLPMGFYRKRQTKKRPRPGTMLFCRETNNFCRVTDYESSAEVVDPADGPYNVYDADGNIVANKDRRYVCGQTVYRFTGIELVNTAIEQNPNRQLVCRIPDVHAHPGIAYLDRDLINLLPTTLTRKVSVKGMYFEMADGSLVPLAQLTPFCSENMFARRWGATDTIIVTEKNGKASMIPNAALRIDDHTVVSSSYTHCDRNSFIGVRYDAAGRKIFYRFKASFPPLSYRINADDAKYGLIAGKWRKSGMIIFPNPHIFPHAKDFRGDKRSDFKMEIWDRNRHGSGGREIKSPGKLRARHYKYQWRWRKKMQRDTMDQYLHTSRDHCLIRIKYRVGYRYTPWHYFHIYSNARIAESGERIWIRVSKARQVRTALKSAIYQ